MEAIRERTVWIYWENLPGHTEPPYIELCRRLLFKSSPGCNIVLVTPQNLRDYLPDLPNRLDKITLKDKPGSPCIAIKCDFIRCFLLEKYGGLYIDSDAIVLKDLGPVFDLFDRWEFVGMRRTTDGKRHISIGFYGSRPNGVIITEYAKLLRAMLSERTAFAWADAGATAITPIVDQHLDRCFLFPEQMLHPINASEKWLFLSERQPIKPFLSEDPMMFMLFHRMFESEVGQWTEEQLIGGNILLSKVFRHALTQ